jgi:uncharacterized protein YdeI (YjbR/CyaY-like superfamily)
MAVGGAAYGDLLVETREEWRAWLAEHHASVSGIWAVTWRKDSGGPVVTYEDLVEEALCFGWVDSRGGRRPDGRTGLLLTPRRPTSAWSGPNKERVARLQAAGLMTAAGQAVVDAAKASGRWTALDAVERLEVPDDLGAAFEAHPGSRDHWEAFPRSARRAILEWISTAKRPETRAARVAETARQAALGVRANERPRRD